MGIDDFTNYNTKNKLLSKTAFERAIEDATSERDKLKRALGVLNTNELLTNPIKKQIEAAIAERQQLRAMENKIATAVSEYQKLQAAYLSPIDRIRKELALHSPNELNATLGMGLKVVFDDFVRPFQDFKTALADAANVALVSYLEVIKGAQAAAEQIRYVLGPVEQLRATFAAIPELDRDRLKEWFSKFGEELQREWSEEERRCSAILRRRGFVGLESHITSEQLHRILELAQKKKNTKKPRKNPVDAFVFSMFRANEFALLDSIVRTWGRVPYMAVTARKRTVRTAISAHKRGEYGLTIPALLPLIDGLSNIIVDGSPNLPWQPAYVKEAAEAYHEETNEVWSECIVQVVTGLIYKSYKPNRDLPPSSINRHGILHGQLAGYASERNSYRVILLLDVFVRMAEQKLKGELKLIAVKSKPTKRTKKPAAKATTP